jgi:hypothetical protein
MRPGSKRQFENASLYIRNLGNEQAERFGRGSSYLFNDWVERFGPLKDCQARIRRQTIKKMRSDARRRYEHDIGAAYALEFLSYHIEASYLPGEDAASVYDLTTDYISQAGDAARKDGGELGTKAPLKRRLIRAACALRGAIKAEHIGCGWRCLRRWRHGLASPSRLWRSTK